MDEQDRESHQVGLELRNPIKENTLMTIGRL